VINAQQVQVNTPFGDAPTKRLRAIDGMAVTADVWEQAHGFHRESLRYHNMVGHGAGILTGLQVIASDPADASVYVLPGFAIDQLGRMISFTQPMPIDLGATTGPFFLVLSYSESQPRADAERSADSSILYVHSEYSIDVLPALPATPHVELARINRSHGTSAIMVARNPERPGLDEIDLRFRVELTTAPRQVASMAICYAGRLPATSRHSQGVSNLARWMARGPGLRLAVDDNAPITAGLSAYPIVYLVGGDQLQFTRDQMTILYEVWTGGGTILYETCQQGGQIEHPSDAVFLDLMGAFGVRMEPVPADHLLMNEPNFFAVQPAGYETEGTRRVLMSEGVVFSSYDYGCLWQGLRRTGPASREEIRAAMEWGENVVVYAMARRKAKSNA
jgi:hypothetical protein